MGMLSLRLALLLHWLWRLCVTAENFTTEKTGPFTPEAELKNGRLAYAWIHHPIGIECHVTHIFNHSYFFIHCKCSCPPHHVGHEHHENIYIYSYGSHPLV
jgi:hypothetical protein